ncbi:MAG TPA: molybdopterin cofactor-binding domain-containing protein [Stellaceae bacterium]|nr:molybdopterin cofactor-binding domain-containing protein [Stellaceae bacterium]
MAKTLARKKAVQDVNRRQFLIGTMSAGAGLTCGFSLLPAITGSAGEALAAGNFEPTVWYTVDRGGIVTVHIEKAEMGQHVGTAFAQAVAEELEADWKDMRLDYPDPGDKKFTSPLAFITGGSWSVSTNFDSLSRAGAAGRMALMQAGAGMLGVSASEVRAENSKVIAKNGKSVTYAQIVSTGKLDKVVTPDELKAIKLKDPKDYKLIGKPVHALDIPPKTNGTAKYGMDMFVPGMVYAKIARPPVRYGAKANNVDDSEAKKVPGYGQFISVPDPTGTATHYVIAIADSYPAALEAARVLKIDWDLGPNKDVSSDGLLQHAKDLVADSSKGFSFWDIGNAAQVLPTAAVKHEAVYITPLAVHAPMEPMNCVAFEDGGIWHIYSGSQFQGRSTALCAAVAGVKPEQVLIHQVYLGGGFGRRLEADAMVPAVIAAKAVGKPVKLIYSREEDTQNDFFRTLTYQRLQGGVDANGKVLALNQDVCSAWATKRWGIEAFLSDSTDKKGKLDSFSVNGADSWYTIPNHHVRAIENDIAQVATPSGQFRSVAPAWTFWAVESFMDELAHAAKKDPVEFRLAMLDAAGANAGSAPNSVGGAKRIANVLRYAVEKSGYGTKKFPKGTGQGIAVVSSQERSSPTWTACVAEVTVGGDGVVKVNKLTIAIDIGTTVNPDGARAQTEGATLWGLSLALYEQASMRKGNLVQANFDTYTPIRMSQVPDLDIHVLNTGNYPAGVGEPAVTVVAPAVANAVYNAVGARVRTLPLTPDKVKAAMKA